jgi:uncharacterized HAD superfamily protein
MSTEKTIYVDMDDVLCHTASGCLAIIEREFGKQIPFEQLTTFDLGEACGLRSEEISELFRIVHQPDELLKLKPMEEAAAVLNQWLAAGYEIAIVTGRPPSAYEASIEWAMRHKIPYHSFIIVDKYGRFATKNTIAITLSELAGRRFCWAVEDSPIMAEYLANQMQVSVALLNRPWNRTAIEHPIIKRYNHWSEIAAALPNGVI